MLSKRNRSPVVAVTSLLVTVVLVAGCSSSKSGSSPASSASAGSGSSSAAAKKISTAFLVPGTLGDKGYFDSANTGMKKAESDLGTKIKVIEGGYNATSTWTSDLAQLSTGSWDLVMSASPNDIQQMTDAAKQYPNQKYVMLDSTIAQPNVASASFLQNDGAFLAGVLAALAVDNPDVFPLVKGAGKTVGFLGGQDLPVIEDFEVGFKKGVEVVDPSINVLSTYTGNFNDPQGGYNQGQALYQRGAAVIFTAAGPTGLGTLKASSALNRYSIGVDSNQNSLYPQNVLGSDIKKVDSVVYDMIQLASQGKLEYGKTYVYGLENNAIEVALNDALVPASISAKLDTFAAQVKSGAVKVPCVDPYCATVGTATVTK
jgi:basic membrane protein A and related proteins